MAEVDVIVNSRSYRIACKDGEEEHLRKLSEHIDRHAQELARTVGQVGEARLMVMAGLMMGDELSAALDRVDELEKQASSLRTERDLARAEMETAAAVVDTATDRIEALAANSGTA